MKKPEIEQYLLISCSLIIDELNEQYKDVFNSDNPKQTLKLSVNEKFSETDLTMRLGHPFRQMVHYNVVDSHLLEGEKKNHDLFIENKGFKVEVKFPKTGKAIGTPPPTAKDGMNTKEILIGSKANSNSVTKGNVLSLSAGLTPQIILLKSCN